MTRPVQKLLGELVTGGAQKKHGNCIFCLVPMTMAQKGVPHAAFCPWYPEHVDRYMAMANACIEWKKAKINWRDVQDETRQLDGVEYEADPFSPEMVKRTDARDRLYRAERRLLDVIGVTDGAE